MKVIVKTILISTSLASLAPSAHAQAISKGVSQAADIVQPGPARPVLGKTACDGLGELKGKFGGAVREIEFGGTDPVIKFEVTDEFLNPAPSNLIEETCREKSLAYYMGSPEVAEAIELVKSLAIQDCEKNGIAERYYYPNGTPDCKPLKGEACDPKAIDMRTKEDGRCAGGYPAIVPEVDLLDAAGWKNYLLELNIGDAILYDRCLIAENGTYKPGTSTCSTDGPGMVQAGLHTGEHRKTVNNGDGTYTHHYECVPYRRNGKLYVGAMAQGEQCLFAIPSDLADM